MSRRKRRESDVWRRRFWEQTIRDEPDLQRHLDYIHFNPVKRGLVSCPHLWDFFSFHKWVRQGKYLGDWGCVYGGRQAVIPDFTNDDGIDGEVG